MSNSSQHGARLHDRRDSSSQPSVLPEAVVPDYSTLEVVENSPTDSNSRFAEHHQLSPQVAPTPSRDGADAPETSPFYDKELAPIPSRYGADAPEALQFDDKELLKETQEELDKPKRRRCSLLTIVFILSAIILVVVAGIIGGLAGTHKISFKRPSAQPMLDTNGCQIAETSPGLAAVSWIDSQGNTTYRRVFFQKNDTNVIMQSAWDSDNPVWTIKPVTDDTIDTRPNSPIAAAVSNDTGEFDIHVFYLGSNNTVYASYATDPDDDYSLDNLAMAEGLMADNSTDLAATWHDCDTCPLTLLLVFQDEQRQLKVRNNTFTGTTTQTLSLNAVNGSSLALSPLDDLDDSGLRLVFQSPSNNTDADCNETSVLSVATWSDDTDAGVVTWAQEYPTVNGKIAVMTPGALLTSFGTDSGTSVIGQLGGEDVLVAELRGFEPVTTADSSSVPGLKGSMGISNGAASRYGDLFLMSATNGSLAYFTLGGNQDQWHFVEQISITL